MESRLNSGWVFERKRDEQQIVASAHKAGVRICATEAELEKFASPRRLQECISRG